MLIKTLPAHLAAGKSTLVVSDKLAVAGLHRYRATLRAQHDRDPRNNVGMGFVAVRGKPRVLVLQAQAGSSALATSLRDAGWSVQLTGPSGIPTRAEELQAYDAILLNDINAADFVPAQMRLIQSAVRDSGIGMAMIGGENSFLPGGWYGTPVAEALPVDLNIRQRRSFPSTSILIMLDASGSMGMIEDGFQKLRLAGKAAEETVKMMSPIDRVGVAGSTDGIVLVAPMQRLDDKARVIEEIQKLAVGGGGIYVRPSMEKGEEVLMAETSKVRHFILMADGNDCDTQEGAIDVALRMRAHHITTTAIAIGDGKDVEFLKKLAAAGGGTFHLALKANQLPAIFTQDAALMSRSAIEEGAFLPKITGSDEILTGIDSMPPLLAYCIADTRPLARTSMRTRKDDPLLSVWQYGLGQSLAFTSDAQPRWARHWVGWSGFSAFWTQAVRSISRRATSNTYQVNVSFESSKGVLQVNAFDKFGNPLTATNATVRVATPEGAVHDVTLSEGAPGKYTGSFAATDLGSYIVTVAEPDGRGGQRVSASGFSIPYPAEYRTFRTDRGVLARASALANGHEISKPEQALAPVPNPGASITELWPSLMLLSAMLLPLDIAVRRLALPFAEIWSMFLAIVRIRRKTKPIAQQVTVARLQQAKERVNRETPVATPTIIQIKPREATKHEAPKPGASAAQSLLEAKRRRDS